jgi:hypothetical protein
LIRYFGTESNIFIPRDIQILCSSCFSNCKSLSSISFETYSELTRIESRACKATDLSFVLVPAEASFIVGDAFSSSCAVMLIGSDWDAEFRAWNRRHQFGSSEEFERRTCGMRELATKESRDDEERKTRSEPMGRLD